MKEVIRFVIVRDADGNDIPWEYKLPVYESIGDISRAMSESEIVDRVNYVTAIRRREAARSEFHWNLKNDKALGLR